MGEQGASNSRFEHVGIGLAGLLFVVSAVYVCFVGRGGGVIEPGVETITIAHWQLEDGFREGIDKMIAQFEQLKAEQGHKVRVIHTAIPYRGYQQWFTTQLVGHNPADLIEIIGSSHLFQRYLSPLSRHVDKENPFNKGTILEGMPWRDTFIDSMESMIDPVYAEHFAVGSSLLTYRLFVNLDLLEKATGSQELPADLTDWLEDCAHLERYSREVGKPIVPIAVRGFDKMTLRWLFVYYFSQLNGFRNDQASSFCTGRADVDGTLASVINDADGRARAAAAVDIACELGRYFGEGFTAMDLEQSKYLFYSGAVGFLPEGSWNGYSLVQNSPFEVGIVRIPPLGRRHRHSDYFTGKITEAGVPVGGAFGIPKASGHFDLALELLQFMTSYETNQMVMDSCKWPPIVKQARFEGILERFQPHMKGNMTLGHPFAFGYATSSEQKMLETLEAIIVERKDEPWEYFWREFVGRRGLILNEITEADHGFDRARMSGELQRTQLSLGLRRSHVAAERHHAIDTRWMIAAEAYSVDLRSQLGNQRFAGHIRSLQEDSNPK